MADIIEGTWAELPRGGFLTNTSEGLVQLGCPPETIKDSITIYKKVPRIFLLPKFFFSLEKYISLAELEFPIYYNFFFLKSKTVIVCHQNHQKQFEELISNSLFGPSSYNLKQDYLEGNLPDLKKEGSYFVNFNLEEVVEFKSYTYEKGVEVGNIVIEGKEDSVKLKDKKSNKTLELPNHISYKKEVKKKYNKEVFTYPKFGISCLGSSHGFDNKGNTSGFVFWINHKAIVVDPIVDTLEWFFENNIDHSSIRGIILTHTHADHDVGILRLLFENQGRRLKLYTTKTILDIWLKKYSIVTGFSQEKLSSFFDFEQIIVNKDLTMEDNSKFRFRYTLHSIPTIGFDVFYKGISFTYSSDHLNDPKYYQDLLKAKIINQKRFEELSNFKWESTIIYHEAGVPPLHTSIEYLSSLPEAIQKKIRVYHISKVDFEESNPKLLRLAEEQRTEVFLDDHKDISVKKQILNNNFFLKEINLKECETLVSESKEIEYKQNEDIDIKEINEKCLIILSGFVEVKEDNSAIKFGISELIGVGNIVDIKQNYKKLKCLTDVTILSVPAKSLGAFVDKNKIINLENLVSNTQDDFLKCVEKGSQNSEGIFNIELSGKELKVLQSYFFFTRLSKGEEFSTKDYYYIHHSGTYELLKEAKESFFSGPLISFDGFDKNGEKTYRATSDCDLFKISKKNFKYCCEQYPKLGFKFLFHS